MQYDDGGTEANVDGRLIRAKDERETPSTTAAAATTAAASGDLEKKAETGEPSPRGQDDVRNEGGDDASNDDQDGIIKQTQGGVINDDQGNVINKGGDDVIKTIKDDVTKEGQDGVIKTVQDDASNDDGAMGFGEGCGDYIDDSSSSSGSSSDGELSLSCDAYLDDSDSDDAGSANVVASDPFFLNGGGGSDGDYLSDTDSENGHAGVVLSDTVSENGHTGVVEMGSKMREGPLDGVTAMHGNIASVAKVEVFEERDPPNAKAYSKATPESSPPLNPAASRVGGFTEVPTPIYTTALQLADDVSISSKLEKGQRIEARYGGKKTYYPGVISMALGGEKYNILYDDGGAETNIDEALIRKMGSEMEKH
jgi:hypothetical protein